MSLSGRRLGGGLLTTPFNRDWRAFWRSPTNAVDLLLSVGSTVQQFHSVASPWLAVFTCMRFYRVVLAVPRLRRLLLKLGSIFGALLNVVLFVLGMTFLISLVVRAFALRSL